MTRKHHVIFVSVFLTQICMGLQCDKYDYEYQYNFQETVDLFPESKSYKVGDTIWIEYSNPDKKLSDKTSGKQIELDTLSMDFQVTLNALYYTPIDNPPDGYCDFVTPSGLNNGRYLGVYGTSLLTDLGCDNNDYNIKIGIVLKYKGIYSLHLPEERSVSQCATRIRTFPLSRLGYRFNVAEGNKDIYLSIPSYARAESTKVYTENRIDSKLVYIVQVL